MNEESEQKGFRRLGNPSDPILQKIWDSFNDWLLNKKKEIGRDLKPEEYPNREMFEKLIVEWTNVAPFKAKSLIPKGLDQKFWKKDEIVIGRKTNHFYFPLILRDRKNENT